MASGTQNSVGSVWKKWDLHVHTPASLTWNGKRFDQMSKIESEEYCGEIISQMNSTDVAAFAIMDYWTFDGYLRLRRFLRKHREVKLHKKIFPGMELRCEAPTAIRMNVHVLLSDELSDQQLQEFKTSLKIPLVSRSLSNEALCQVALQMARDKLRPLGHSPQDLETQEGQLQIGHKIALIGRDSLFDGLQKLPGGTGFLLLPFDTYRGVEEIDWKEHPLLTTEFMSRADIFEMVRQEVIDASRGIKTPENQAFINNFLHTIGGSPKPAIRGSDAHKIADYGVFPLDKNGKPRNTWIKAVPSFGGLRQILNEPAARVYIGTEPSKVILVRNNPTKYIRSISIHKKSDSDLTDTWFDVDLDLNHDLVAIIGNKGNGKSALADVIGLLTNSSNHRDFSFLSSDRFRQSKQNLANHFQATLIWASGEQVVRSLDEDPPREEPERARYLPQNHLERICNEIKLRKGDGFDAELKAVIFSHVPSAERLGKDTLDDLLEFITKQTHDTITILKSQLSEINGKIIQLEKQTAPEHQEGLERRLQLKQKELQAHEQLKPTEVQPPSEDPHTKAKLKSCLTEIDQTREKLAQIDEQIEQAKADEQAQSILLAKADAIEGHIKNFQRLFIDMEERLQQDLTDLGLSLDQLVSISVDPAILASKRESIKAMIKVAQSNLDESNQKSPFARRKVLLDEIKKLEAQIEGPAKQHQQYVTQLREWESLRDQLIGSEQAPGTIRYLEAILARLANAPTQLAQLCEERRAKTLEIYQEIAKLADTYREVHRPVQEFSNSHELLAEQFNLRFTVGIQPNPKMIDQFFDIISRGAAGSFCGREEGEQMFRDLLEATDFTNSEGAIQFVDKIITYLLEDKREGGKGKVNLEKQLKKGRTLEQLYAFIYSLEYLDPHYSLKLGEKSLAQLSPGERGMLLLMFYLLIDKENVPLIIDQPEGNLDNETVFLQLGKCIKEAKKRRQIIIVTHNPNLAVACDAEQVICANISKDEGNRISYMAGAIEDSAINQKLINILEGTRPAFNNRDSKYLA